MSRILVACEESQAITIAFRKLGYSAFSCDLQPCSGGYPEWHIQGDVLDILNDGWDMMIAHPDCTFLANSGVNRLYNKDGSKNQDRWNNLDEACDFFKKLLNAPIPLIAIENPIPHKHAVKRIGRKYDQIIQPYQFGHLESKATCLWLKGLPNLVDTDNVKSEWLKLSKTEGQKLYYLSPSPDRKKIRSKTFKGIAEAIAVQWSKLLPEV